MRLVTYNIRYGIGLDRRYDPARIADAVRGADLIALQEVTRNGPDNGGADMVAELCALLPDYFHVFGSPYEVDMGSAVEDGRAVTRSFQFGNMVLSKTPVLSSRNLLLPRRRSYATLDLQRGALEAMIATPFGPVRFYSVHLDHTNPEERIAQVKHLIDRVIAYPLEGGAVTGVSELGFAEPPHPEEFVLLGDFNMEPGSPEYFAMTGMPDREHGVTLRADRPVDAATLVQGAAEGRITWFDPERHDDLAQSKCLDYIFVHAGLAPKVRTVRIDDRAIGSDHRPVWVELG